MCPRETPSLSISRTLPANSKQSHSHSIKRGGWLKASSPAVISYQDIVERYYTLIIGCVLYRVSRETTRRGRVSAYGQAMAATSGVALQLAAFNSPARIGTLRIPTNRVSAADSLPCCGHRQLGSAGRAITCSRRESESINSKGAFESSPLAADFRRVAGVFRCLRESGNTEFPAQVGNLG